MMASIDRSSIHPPAWVPRAPVTSGDATAGVPAAWGRAVIAPGLGLATGVALILLGAGVGSSLVALAGTFALALTVALVLPVELAIVVALYWLILQNLVLPAMFSSGVFPAPMIRIMVGIKEMVFVSILGRLILRIRMQRRDFTLRGVDWWFIAFTVFAACHLFLPGSLGFGDKLLALRVVLIQPLLFFTGRLFVIGQDQDERFRAVNGQVMVLGTITAVAGLVLFFFVGLELWQELRVGAYWTEVKGLPESFVDNGLPGNFIREFDETRPRLVSFPGDPLATAYFLFFVAVLYLPALRHRPRWLVPGFVAVLAALVATNTRAALLGLIVAIYFYARRRAARAWLAPLSALGATAGLLAFPAVRSVVLSTITVSDASSAGHVELSLQGLLELRNTGLVEAFIGRGLGIAGGFTAAADQVMGVLENIYLSLFAQLGITGVVLFLAATIAALRVPVRSPEEQAVKAAGIGLLVTGLVSEQIMTATSAGPFWLLLGMIGAAGPLTRGEPSRRAA
jgi:hypothetical protein